MNLLDLILVLLGVSAAIGGYRLGLMARVISWLGLALGVLLGVAILPGLLRRLEGASDVSIVLVEVATLLGCGLVGQGLGLTLGSKLHIALPEGTARKTDRAAGAVSGVVGVLIGLWLLLPTLGEAAWTADQARTSSIAAEVDRYFPEPPGTIQDLRRAAADGPFPQVLDALAPAPDPGPPPGAHGLGAETVARATQATVKVQGVACNRVQEGTGFLVEDDLFVTNAHVVAGEDETEVQFQDGSTSDAAVVAYDPVRDLALLRADDGGRQPLTLREAQVGDSGGVFGHPGGGPLEISPFQVGDLITAVGQDIYDQRDSRRRVLVLASELRPGDSGAALVDGQGNVIGVAFAVAPDKSNVAYALALEELAAVRSGDISAPKSTNGCLG